MGDNKHYRVTCLADGVRVIQRPHFKSIEDAEKYIEFNKSILPELKQIEIVVDFDERIYPVWRDNLPSFRKELGA